MPGSSGRYHFRPNKHYPEVSAPDGSFRLADDCLEFCGIKRLHGFGPDIAQRRKLCEATQHFLFLAAENEHAVASANSPELSFDGDPCLQARDFAHTSGDG